MLEETSDGGTTRDCCGVAAGEERCPNPNPNDEHVRQDCNYGKKHSGDKMKDTGSASQILACLGTCTCDHEHEPLAESRLYW